MSQIRQVPAHNWEAWVAENNGLVLDIREAREWKQGTLPGSQTLAMSQIQARVDEIPRDRPILCVCRSGSRSNQVASFLNSLGYEASNMAGGMKALGMQS